MNNNLFIFAIAYNCGLVMKKCLESYHKFHNDKIYIFGTKNDFNFIEYHENNILIDITEDKQIKNAYNKGHLGTAHIWANVITKKYDINYEKIIQIDSDIVFLKECLSDIKKNFEEGYDLIGARRSYKSIPNLKDVVSTFFIGVNLEKITKRNYEDLVLMIAGFYNPANHQTIDFFDPISFDILYNKGKINYLNFLDYGSCDETGNFDNENLEMNTLFDYGKKIIHFAGIGSGMNFYNNGHGEVPLTYVEWAKKRYSLYLKFFYNKEIDVEYDKKDYQLLKENLKIN